MTLSPPEREAQDEKNEANGTAQRRRWDSKRAEAWWRNVERQKRTGDWTPADDDPWKGPR